MLIALGEAGSGERNGGVAARRMGIFNTGLTTRVTVAHPIQSRSPGGTASPLQRQSTNAE